MVNRCDYCRKTYSDIKDLISHLVTHQQCAKCEFRTSDPHEMDNHSSIHKRKSEEPYDGLSQKSRRIAFKNRMYELKWHYRGVPDLLHCFSNYREKMQRRLAWYLQKVRK